MNKPALTVIIGTKSITTHDEFMKCFQGLELNRFCEIMNCFAKNIYMNSQIRYLDTVRFSQLTKLEVKVSDVEINIEPFEIKNGEVQCLF